MITIAPKSSIIAKAVKKTFNDSGTLFPNKERTPKEKAISVAEGIAQPFKVVGVLKLITIYIRAGINIPPTAPIIGSIACLIEDSSPCKNSLLISKVTKKKNIAINASLIQWSTLSFRPKSFIPINKYSFKTLKYKSEKFELLIYKAIIALIRSKIPLAASNLKNHLKPDVI